jgi:AcrR family transcriptional regulator
MEPAAESTRSELAEALVRATEAEITENGIGSLSMRAVARRVGVSHQAPGFLFRDRKGMLTALAVDGFDRLANTLRDTEERLPPKASPAERLAASGFAYVTFADHHPALHSVMMRPELQHVDDPELVRARGEAYAVLLGTIDEAHAAGWGAGHSRDDLALSLWALVQGIVTLWRDGDIQAVYPDASIEDVTARITGVIASALDS